MVRFIRAYDVREDRIVNVWQNLKPESAGHLSGVEWCEVGESFEKVMARLERVPWLLDELPKIREAYKHPHEAKPSIYYTADAL